MKIIIDIDEDVYTRLFDNGIQDNEIATDDICEMARSLRQGTSLDKIRAEITEYAIPDFEYHGCGGSQKIVELEDVLDIIDRKVKENTDAK